MMLVIFYIIIIAIRVENISKNMELFELPGSNSLRKINSYINE